MSSNPGGNTDPELPAYSERLPATLRSPATGTEHSYSLEDGKGRKWVTLFVKSRSKSAKLPPLFKEHDLITGRVALDLGKPEAIKAIVVSVTAGSTAVGQEEIVFLDVNKELWTPSMDNSGGKKTLSGRHSWPFSIELPHEVTVPDPSKQNRGTPPATLPLPPTFTERASPAYIDYRLIVTVKRGALRVNQVLTTNFGYQPMSYSDPPSALRQLSYREGSRLIGPDGDPEGWKVLAPVAVKGTLFDAREVQATCILAVATPLCFALGSPVPLTMTIASPDSQALDVLSQPSSIRLHLVRSIATGSDATGDDLPRRSCNFFTESAGQAMFWTSDESPQVEGKRTLQGELHVGRSLKPSFVFPRFTVRYTLDLLTFKAPGFQSAMTDPSGVLVSEKVRIVTAQTPGVQPCSYTPPGYAHQQGGDYNTAMGYLENGNQRFFHHHGFGIGMGSP